MSITLTLEQVQDMAQEAGIGIDEDDYRHDEDEGYLYLNYSGRGMYGRTCLGIVGSIGNVIKFIIAVHDDFRLYPENWPHGFVPDQLVDPSTDSMGRDTIYYWPTVKVGKEES